jgi:hypothetical protein
MPPTAPPPARPAKSKSRTARTGRYEARRPEAMRSSPDAPPPPSPVAKSAPIVPTARHPPHDNATTASAPPQHTSDPARPYVSRTVRNGDALPYAQIPLPLPPPRPTRVQCPKRTANAGVHTQTRVRAQSVQARAQIPHLRRHATSSHPRRPYTPSTAHKLRAYGSRWMSRMTDPRRALD